VIPVAIIGIGCRFPGANGPDRLWELLAGGIDAIQEVPTDRWDAKLYYDSDPNTPGKANSKWGGFLEGIRFFDFDLFGISPREAAYIDPQQRLLLEMAWAAVEDSGLVLDDLKGSQTGVFVGLAPGDYCRLLMKDPGNIGPYTNTGNLLSIAANRISYLFDLRGPSIAIETACSSALVAVHLACSSLDRGDSTLAFAGGVNAILTPELTIGFSKIKALSPDGRCKAFDAEANGYVRGEGAGLVVLKPLSKAIYDGDTIYAVIRGSAVNQDGRTNGLTAPNRFAQEEVLRAACRHASVRPADVQYVEAHGTGTLLGDVMEANALGTVIGSAHEQGSPCAIGSVKTNIGHLETAAGIAGLIKVALSLRHRKIPPSLHFNKPNPHIDFGQLGLKVQDKLGDWPSQSGPRLAGVSSFGFGGTNAHVVVEEPPDLTEVTSPRAEHTEGTVLLPISARSPQALRDLAQAYCDLLHDQQSVSFLADLGYSAACRRTHHDYRLALVAPSCQTMREALNAFIGGEKHASITVGRKRSSHPGRPAFAFSEEEAEPAMAAEYLREQPVALQMLAACHSLWRETSPQFERHGKDFGAAIDLFASQLAFAALWRSWGISPVEIVAWGAGEVAAIYAAGALDLADAVRLLLLREQISRHEARPGAGSIPQEILDGFRALRALHPVVRVFSAKMGWINQDKITDPLYWVVQAEQTQLPFTSGAPRETPGYETLFTMGLSSSRSSKVLTHPGLTILPIRDVSEGGNDVIRHSVATLYALGYDLDWKSLQPGKRNFIKLPPHPQNKQYCWVDFGSDKGAPDVLSHRNGAAGAALELQDSAAIQERITYEISANDARPRDPLILIQGCAQEQAGKESLESLKGERRLDSLFDRLCSTLIAKSLSQCGIFETSEQSFSFDDILERCGVHGPRRHLVLRLVGILMEDGLVVDERGQYRRVKGEHLPDAETLAAAITREFPFAVSATRLLRRCMAALPAVWSGKVSSIEVLFEGGSMAELADFYAHFPPLARANSMAAEAAGRIAHARLPGPFKVLEIGGGTGALTSSLLPTVAGRATNYVFTDVGPSFLRNAQRAFKEYAMLSAAVFDLDKDPRTQGFAPEGFDLIVGANVLHATPDVRRSLRHLRQVLHRDGHLILVETVRPNRFADCTVGLLDGWWAFRDTELRKAYPLLNSEQWRSLLRAEGFRVALAPAGAEPSDLAVVIAALENPLLSDHRDTGHPETISEWRAPAGGLHLARSNQQKSPVTSASVDLESYIAAQIASAMGIAAAEIDLDRSLTSLGVDSLTALQLINRIQSDLAVALTLDTLFSGDSIADIIDLIKEKQRMTAVPKAQPAGIVPCPRNAQLPLSYSQQRLWFLDCLQPGSAAYNVSARVQMSGLLNVPFFQQAMEDLVTRHEGLRTTFTLSEGQPVQVISPPAKWIIPIVDLRSLAASERQLTAGRLAREEAQKPFDLLQGPLLRATLLQLESQHHVLLITLHHIVCDGWSLQVLLREFTELYEALRNGRPSPLRPLKIQYADFALWQHRCLKGERLEQLLQYWRVQIAGVEPLELPTDHARPTVASYAGGRVSFNIPGDLTEELRKLSRNEQVTMFMLLLASFQVLVSRYAGQQNVSVGSPVANRNNAEIEDLVGCFVNTLVLRADVRRTETFRSLLRNVRETTLQAYAHQDAPFEKVVEALQPPRDLSRSPLVQVVFSMNVPWEFNQIKDLTLTPVEQDTGTVPFDLTMGLRDAGTELTGSMMYRSDLFEEDTVNRMVSHYVELLQAITEDPERKVSELPLLTKREREQILLEWSGDAGRADTTVCVHQMFEQQTESSPDAVAVVHESGTVSYGELNRQANQVAGHLRGLGVTAEVRVGICMQRGVDLVVAILAVLKAGGVYVPLDPNYPAERLRFMAEDAQMSILLTHSGSNRQLDGMRVPIVQIDRLGEPVPGRDDVNVGSPAQPDNAMYLIYTSGSTGSPKGVVVTHANVARLFAVTQPAYGFSQSDTWTLFHSYAFDFSVWELWGALIYGGKLVVVTRLQSQSPDVFHNLLRTHAVTVLNQTPSAFQQLMQVDQTSEARLSLRLVIFGGEELNPVMLAPWFDRHPEIKLANMYGITETTVHATYKQLTEGDLRRSGHSPIGTHLADLQTYVLDRDLEPQPTGVAGELYIGGAGLARGYWNRPELTAERFVPNPFSPNGERLYRSGDLACWRSDGNIEFLGRNDFQVKIRGFRIELGEIEARLAEHPAVRDAVVIAREDTPGDKRLVAYYTAAGGDSEPDAPSSAERLRLHLSAVLPEYMVPAAYVQLEALPLTSNGKLDRIALSAPEADAYSTGGYEAPQSKTETILAEIWAELLRLDRIGRHDNFFELGGHSLLGIRVITRLVQALRVEVAIRDLFAHPVLADLAQAIESAAHVALPPITPAKRSERLPLSFAQQRLWFLAQMEGASDAYNVPFGVYLKGDVDHEALRRTLDRILIRHEALRTTFAFIDGEPVQQLAIAKNSRFLLLEHDLRGHDKANAELDRLIGIEAGAAFDLEHGPLIRGRLIRLAEDEHALLITMHHIVSDGWSMGVLVNELSTLYGAFLRGEADPLPELEIQYADYAVWQRQWVEGDILQQQATYWKVALAGAPALLELPLNHPRPAQQNYTGAFAELVLDEQLTAGLRELSLRHGTTLYMTLLAGWAVLLARLSGQQDVVIGSPVANRGRIEIENLIGFFVNTMALRLDLSGSPSVSELLEQTKAQVLGAQQHQDIPFEQVVELVRPVRSLAHSPLFQVMFAWQNATERSLELPGLEVQPIESALHMVAKFDLTLSLQEAGNTIAGGIEYAASLFELATIERYLGYFRTLVEGMVADDTQAVDRLLILSKPERHQVLYEWNETSTEFASDRCVHELFEEQVGRSPEATAVVFEGAELSYAELNRRANRIAHYLRELGVRPDARVAICVERGFEMIVALLGVLKAGGAYVPLDPAYPAERLGFMLEDSDPIALLTQTHLQQLFTGLSSNLQVLDLAAAAPPWEDQPETNPHRDSIGLTPEHLAYVIYTSGSTGAPKGVMVQHTNVVRLFTATEGWFNFSADDVWTLFHSCAFDFSVWEIWGALLYGGRLITVPNDIVRSPEDFYHLVCLGKVTVLNQTPGAFRQLIAAQAKSEESHQLRHVIFGGEALEVATLKPWYEQNRDPRTRLINMYGITETTVHVTYRPLKRHDIERRGGSPIGRRIPDLRIYILDERREPVPVGVAGELYIGGAGVARGYLNRPELTAERFLKDPFTPETGVRMYRTGDLGRWQADGNIEFLGRNDFQVKIRGFRIELGEIEARLAEHPAVREAVVIAREDTPGDKRLVAYYASLETGDIGDQQGGETQETALGAEQLRAHLAARLPEYMVPAAYVRLQSLPLTSNGKLDRNALTAPEQDAYAVRGYEPPQGGTETRLAQIWAEVLQLDKVGRHDNFFELGGHSLLAVTLVNVLQQAGMKISTTDVFKHPTIESMVTRIGLRSALPLPDAAILLRGGSTEHPLFLAHDGTGELLYIPALAPYIDEEIPVYGLPASPVGETELKTVEEMATRMVQMIRSVQPVGPFRIGGWSFGGMLAYEIAVQLIAAGQHIDFLGMLDTSYPPGISNFPKPLAHFDDKEQLLLFIQEVSNPEDELKAESAAIRSISSTMGFEELVKKSHGLLPMLMSGLFGGATTTQIRNWLARAHSYRLAMQGYSAQQIPIPVHLFATRKGADTNPALGWDVVVPDNLRSISQISGTHHSMLEGPHVRMLGHALSLAIRNAAAGSIYA
jgi:amino acid adenylation domain-containing protein